MIILKILLDFAITLNCLLLCFFSAPLSIKVSEDFAMPLSGFNSIDCSSQELLD